MNLFKIILLILAFITFLAWCVLTLINLWYKSKIGGRVVVNIRRGLEKKIMIFMGVSILICSLMNNSAYEIIEVFVAIVIFYNGAERFEIMENGIFIEGNFKKWEDIQSCGWHERLKSTLIIKGKEDIDFFRRFNTIKLKLKKDEQDKVFYVINKNIENF
ncbi:DUF5673 domain-containing protein [Clostridium oceanicum]|uniref:DUF5673 domain-containing protein n=1 Tax=Clostridium oceanicum TaxID=1543 RepID=A0ABP3UNT2_9CLOT